MASCRRILFLIPLVLLVSVSLLFAAPPQRMRPYTGIGLFLLPQSDSLSGHNQPLQLFEEPGLVRMGVLNSPAVPGNEWIFAPYEGAAPLIVSARKGDWLRVVYDDAGREVWIRPENTGGFQSWEQFFKRQTCRMLPGLQPKYYQLLRQPGGEQAAVLTPKQVFRVQKTENSWCLVQIDQGTTGWIRWQDEDGRLLVGPGR